MDDGNAFPMVAVRTSGLAFQSLIGIVPNRTYDQEDEAETEEHVALIVSDEYLELLVKIANERFKANAERIQRFEQDVFKREEGPRHTWEDSKSRQERKRAEGLEQQTMRKAQMTREGSGFSTSNIDEDIDNAGLFALHDI